MKELVEAIRTHGKGIGTDIVKVDMFLNHRLDTDLFVKMGQAFASVFAAEKPDLVLTIEASGIAVALTTAMACGNVPVVFAKKSKTKNISNNVYSVEVASFTHGNTNTVVVSKEYLSDKDRVLIVDDFLATGAALVGLKALVEQAGGVVVGAGIAVEKVFQGGGDMLRSQGLRVESLAKIASMDDHGLKFC